MKTLSKPKIFVLIAFFVLLVLLVLLARFFGFGRGNSLHKLVMPGSYTAFLEGGDYKVWIFRNWDTKGIHADKDEEVQVQVESEKAQHFVKLEKMDPDPTELYQETLNKGRFEYVFTLADSGFYNISSSATCVVVIVPTFEVYSTIGSNFTVNGIDDDSNFDRPGRYNTHSHK